MILVNELRGVIAKQGLSQRKVARHLGISEKTFYEKMGKGVFRSDEIEQMITLLQIEHPAEIFFAQHGTKYATGLGGDTDGTNALPRTGA